MPLTGNIEHVKYANSGNGDLDLSIIIVSWNVCQYLAACIESIIENQGGLNIEVIVVDNNSDDDSTSMIRMLYPWVNLIVNEENVGFAAANNVGLAHACGRFLLLLNPDTELREGCLEKTIQHLDQHAELGVVGCRVFRRDGQQQSTMFLLPRMRDVLVNAFVPNAYRRRFRFLGRSRYLEADLELQHEVEVIAGCFMLLRRETYQQTGGMDEGYFMYGEEAEWCHRIGRKGWKVGYYPGADILHHGGISAGHCPDEMNLAMSRSQLLLMQHTRGIWAAYVANVLMLLRDGVRVLGLTLLSIVSVRDRPARVAAVRRYAQRFGLHARGLLRLDWNS